MPAETGGAAQTRDPVVWLDVRQRECTAMNIAFAQTCVSRLVVRGPRPNMAHCAISTILERFQRAAACIFQNLSTNVRYNVAGDYGCTTVCSGWAQSQPGCSPSSMRS